MALDDTLFQCCLKNPNLPFLKSSQSVTILLLVFAATANPWLRQWEVLGESDRPPAVPNMPARSQPDLEHIPQIFMASGSLYLKHKESSMNFKGPPIDNHTGII